MFIELLESIGNKLGSIILYICAFKVILNITKQCLPHGGDSTL